MEKDYSKQLVPSILADEVFKQMTIQVETKNMAELRKNSMKVRWSSLMLKNKEAISKEKASLLLSIFYFLYSTISLRLRYLSL